MMQAPIVIIGSGFAAYQLVKTLRRMDATTPIQIFTADDGAEYNKPDLSHVFTRKQTAQDLVVKTAAEFAQEHQVELFTHTPVENIDIDTQQITAGGCHYSYAKLVFATGANAFVPPMGGNATQQVMTLNSLTEYQDAEVRLSNAQRILVIGGGLIGVEIAMDLASSGKTVTIVEPNSRLLASLLPEFIALPLEKQLLEQGVQLALDTTITEINHTTDGVMASLSNGQFIGADSVISAAGLRANTKLAQAGGIKVNRGISVDGTLQTSANNVYALGDCAEIQGQMMPFLQPIVLSANALAKSLLGEPAELRLPAMMVKVKTPSYPIQLAGQVNQAVSWNVQFSTNGIIAKAEDEHQHLLGFVVTGEQVTQAFPMLRELSLASQA
ncbi:NADH:flavorubredoxin reductase NorW [Vibrio panuliri]